MQILILGASGATGRQIVAQALDRGDRVTAFVRDPARLPLTHPGLRMVQGDVSDAAAVARAMQGQDAVLSALGVGRPLRHDAAVVAGIGHVIAAMRAGGVRRLVYLSFTGVRESRARAGWVV